MSKAAHHQTMSVPLNLTTMENAQITPEMLPLITLSQAEIDSIIAQVPGGAANIQDIYGLTPTQNNILYDHIMSQKGDANLEVSRLRFIDRTSMENYANAWQQMIERHDILRTAFFWQDLNEPAQVVLRQVPRMHTKFTQHEFGKPVLEQLIQEFDPRRYRMDLTHASLLRLMAAPDSDGTWVALQLTHNLLIDHSTLDRLQREIHAVMNGSVELLKTPIPFRHFVAQVRLNIKPDNHIQFFTEMLGDIDEPTLPFGVTNADQIGSTIDEAQLMLPQTLNDEIRKHANNLQVSVASICQLAWAQVLSRASGRDAVVFGIITGTENHNIMGPTINTLPIRLNIDGKCVGSAVLDTHTRLNALLAHKHAPPVIAQRCSSVPMDLPLFSALLDYRHSPTNEVNTIPGLLFLDSMGQSKYPLILSIDDNDGSLRLSVKVVSPISATRICAYMHTSLQSLVNALTHTPQQALKTLEVMPTEEKTLLVHTWNPTKANDSPLCCLHQIFEFVVKNFGERIAVNCESQTLSYAGLNVQANRVANYLIARGVKPDDCIALCVKRSTAMVVGILGILKAGCAYVPLDPAYQSQRLHSVLLEANPIFLLADAAGRDVLGGHQTTTIDLEKVLLSELPIHNPDSTKLGLMPHHLAYVIYTSGSTGTPKGVMVEHRNIVRHLEAAHQRFDFNANDKWCLFHSMAFDLSLSELWGALWYGGQVFVVPYHLTHSIDELYDWICASGISVLIQTPSVFKIMMKTQNIQLRMDKLRYVICGGEKLDPTIVTDWYKNYDRGQTTLVNRYGPTEATLNTTFYFCDRTFGNESLTPIGRPLSNKLVYLLDAQRRLVPIGATGEIYIGGCCVTRGYLNRQGFTAERFLPDPFNSEPGARMYRTGDLARYLPDGNLVFLGRIDHQVKIRGFRIELGEIEARLLEHPDVNEAVVLSYGDGSDIQLVAYIVGKSDTRLALNLRTYLLGLLPDYMVPSAYVRLPSFPLTPNGKLNRRALPAPDEEALARQHYEPPQGEMEEKLANIWRELLSIDRISRHDNFFALGGHSLLVVNLLVQLRKLGLNTTVREVFDAPDLAALALTLIRYSAVTIPPNLITKNSTKITPEMLPLIDLTQADIDTIVAQVPGEVANIQDIYGLTPLQNGMLYHHLMAKKGDPYLLVSRLSFLDRKSLERYADAMQQVIERHDVLRTAMFWDGLSEPAQVVLRQVPSLLTEIALSEAGRSELDQLNEKFHPRHYRLDLTQAPLLRLLAAPTSNGGWVAMQLTHHSMVDHLTLDRLQAEIHAIMTGKSELLTAVTAFRDFVAQARLAISAAEHTQFFTEMLGDIDEPTLPFGLSDVDQDGSDINEAYLELPQILYDQLRELARNSQVSLASICHLAWALVLHRATGRAAVVFGTVLLGRLQAAEGNNIVIGPLINTLPIRLNIDDKSVESAVRDSHARLSALLDHEHASLVLAQRCSGVLAGSPLFSALLNYRHNQSTEEIKKPLPGVSVIDSQERTNYPLILSVEDNMSSLGLKAQVMSPISAERICSYMQKCLESLTTSIAHAAHQTVRELSVVPSDERTLLLHNWNQMVVSHSSACCLHQLFEAQVELDGQAIAVECNGQTLNYSELNIQANRLAHYLIGRGVKPDDRIALCVDRSIAMIVAILGILKAGCAYVPLDPVYSSQRLNNILLDAGPIFLLADASGRIALGDHQVPLIEIENSLPAGLQIDNPDPTKLGLTPAHLAYIIYTSGSTGTPKGVMIEHRHVDRLISVTNDKFGFNEKDKWCLFHSFSFDVSVWEIWGALLHGCQLSIVPYSTIRTTNEFYDWMCTSGITVLNQTPSAFKMLMRVVSDSAGFDQLRFIVFAGEELDPLIPKNWFEKYTKSRTQLINMYGTTETTVHATFQRIQSPNDVGSVGRPLPDLPMYLLDSYGEPVLLGAEGEIYIGGAGVGRGYLNRPELNAQRFVCDPFSNDPAARMYRTGDLARYLPDGNLVYLGRMDQQVKIRGFRIELGEIEARLLEHPDVHETTVQCYKNESDTRLAAYVVANGNSSLAQTLRTYLSNILPEYMVPAAYICLPSFPLTTSGKLDRRALPAPDEESFARQKYEPPQGEMEEKLAQIWRELLSIDRISRNDNFFELGGHSLLVMRFVNKAKLCCNAQIDARGVFSFPILKNLAEQITNRSKRSYCDAAIPVRQHGTEPPLFLLPDGWGDSSYAFELAHDIDKNIPVYVLPWSSPDDKQPASIEEMADAMIARIKAVSSKGPCAIVGYSDGGILAYEITKQLMTSGYSVSFLGFIDTYAPKPNPNSITESFLTYLSIRFPVFKQFDGSEWWSRISKLSLDKAVAEIYKANLDLTNIDIEWEALMSKQRHNYQYLCATYEIDLLPIRINLFKANKIDQNKKLSYPKLGWEKYNFLTDFKIMPIDGDHYTMITDSRNRSMLGKKLTQLLHTKTDEA